MRSASREELEKVPGISKNWQKPSIYSYTANNMNLPNLLTLSRILMIP